MRPFSLYLCVCGLLSCADPQYAPFQPRLDSPSAAKADTLSTSRQTQSGQASAEATRIPWSGYWWSMEEGELVLGWDNEAHGRRRWSEAEVRAFDRCLAGYGRTCRQRIAEMAGTDGSALSPLMKFDLYVRRTLAWIHGEGEAPASAYSHAALWELRHHYIGTNREHRFWASRNYAGKCIGWALATFDYDEPTQAAVLQGVQFQPGDIKGVLSAIYNGAQFFVPDDKVVGQEYHEGGGRDTPERYADVLPQDFLRALAETIDRGTFLEADMDPGDGVWNYPIYKYDLKWKRRSPGRVAGSVKVFYADDEVDRDEVFSTRRTRDDLLSRKLGFVLEVPPDWDGDLTGATGGRWTGASKDQHPDAVILGLEAGWRQAVYEYRHTAMNTELNFELIKRADEDAVEEDPGEWPETVDSVPYVDVLLADYYRQ